MPNLIASQPQAAHDKWQCLTSFEVPDVREALLTGVVEADPAPLSIVTDDRETPNDEPGLMTPVPVPLDGDLLTNEPGLMTACFFAMPAPTVTDDGDLLTNEPGLMTACFFAMPAPTVTDDREHPNDDPGTITAAGRFVAPAPNATRPVETIETPRPKPPLPPPLPRRPADRTSCEKETGSAIGEYH